NECGPYDIVLGEISSALLLYGIGKIYGTTGSTHYSEIGKALSTDTGGIDEALFLGLALTMAGLGFKVAAVPFHMWTPDAYEGAPLPVTALIAAISNSGGFALFLKLFAEAFEPKSTTGATSSLRCRWRRWCLGTWSLSSRATSRGC